jgi:hypothetical protein
MLMNKKFGQVKYLVAEAKGCSLKTVYNMINNGEDSDGYKVVTEVILKKTMINLNRYKGVLVGK